MNVCGPDTRSLERLWMPIFVETSVPETCFELLECRGTARRQFPNVVAHSNTTTLLRSIPPHIPYTIPECSSSNSNRYNTDYIIIPKSQITNPKHPDPQLQIRMPKPNSQTHIPKQS
jgi:hypothetical protein